MTLLSEFLRIVFPCITLFAGFVMGFLIYRAGFDDGRRTGGTGKIPERKPIIRLPKAEKPIENSPYYDDILRNIEVYDGTENGQREVRRK